VTKASLSRKSQELIDDTIDGLVKLKISNDRPCARTTLSENEKVSKIKKMLGGHGDENELLRLLEEARQYSIECGDLFDRAVDEDLAISEAPRRNNTNSAIVYWS
jgi:intein/homing endonuclease